MRRRIIASVLALIIPLLGGVVVQAPAAHAAASCAWDYAWARPNVYTLAGQCLGVVRYVDINASSNGKLITRSELANLRGAGLQVGLVFERWATRASEGWGAGVEDATRTNQALGGLGLPTSTVVRVAVDWDAAWWEVRSYIDGWLSVRSKQSTGVYGSVRIVKSAYEQDGLRNGWPTYAWRYSQDWPDPSYAPIRQTSNGSEKDYNVLLAQDWGQIGSGGEAPAAGSSSGSTTSTSTYTVLKGDYLSGAVQRACGVSWTTIAAANGISSPYTIYPGQRIVCSGGAAASSSAAGSYRVKSGDYLSGAVARSCGTSWTTIAKANGLRSPYIIYPGQTLRCQ